MTQDMVLMPRALTAENGAKALLLGEFTIEVDEPRYCECGEQDCEECEVTQMEFLEPKFKVMVPWTTIKEIYAKAVEHLKQEV